MPRQSGKRLKKRTKPCSRVSTRSKRRSVRASLRSELTELESALDGTNTSDSSPVASSCEPHPRPTLPASNGRRSKPERELADALRAAGVSPWVEELRFHKSRRWKFDFAWPHLRIAAEVEGGIFIGGRHSRAAGFIADCEKYNAATLDGWSVYRFPVARRREWLKDAVDTLAMAVLIKEGPRVALP
jgi:hypothetical protein